MYNFRDIAKVHANYIGGPTLMLQITINDNFMFRSSQIFVFCLLVFWPLHLRDFPSVFFHLFHLTLQNVNKDNVIFMYFSNFVTKSDQKPKTKNGMNKTLETEL